MISHVDESAARAAVSEAAEAAPAPRFGLRARALIVGIVLVAAISTISVYGDMVSKSVQFGVLQLAPPAVVGLFLLTLANRGLSRWLGRTLLNAGDILVIYTMMLVGVMISTRGAIEKIIPPLTYLPYHATVTNNFNALITRHLPHWMLPFVPGPNSACPDGLKAYYEGLQHGQSIPFGAWVGPLLAMFVLVACVIWVFICLSVLLRRQWMDNERLGFPLTTLPVALIRNEIDGKPFLRNPAVWGGFLVPAVVFTINGIHANYPSLPDLPLSFNISSLLTIPPWSQMDTLFLECSFAAIGFAYFLPNDLLFSLWFFFLLSRLQDLIMAYNGIAPVSIGTHNARVFTGYQAAGAYIVLVGSYIILGRQYFSNVFRTAFTRRKTLDDSDEMLSYRTAIIGIVVGFAGIVAWLTIAGMSPLLAAAIMGIYLFFIAVIMTRAVNEAGLLMTETSFLPQHLVQLVFPASSWGATNLSLNAVVNTAFVRDLRGVMLSPLTDSQKMAGDLRLRMRSLLAPFLTAFVVAFVVASFVFLSVNYRFGDVSLYQYPDGNASNMYNRAASQITHMALPVDSTAVSGLGIGLVATLALVRLRTLIPWFPLHPLAYAIAPTWAMIVLWFPCLVAWMIKAPVMRYGGMPVYRRLRPFMLGMILGEFTMAMVWALLSIPAIGLSAPDFPWP